MLRSNAFGWCCAPLATEARSYPTGRSASMCQQLRNGGVEDVEAVLGVRADVERRRAEEAQVEVHALPTERVPDARDAFLAEADADGGAWAADVAGACVALRDGWWPSATDGDGPLGARGGCRALSCLFAQDSRDTRPRTRQSASR